MTARRRMPSVAGAAEEIHRTNPHVPCRYGAVGLHVRDARSRLLRRRSRAVCERLAKTILGRGSRGLQTTILDRSDDLHSAVAPITVSSLKGIASRLRAPEFTMPAIFRILLVAMSLTAGIGGWVAAQAEPIAVLSATDFEKLSGFFEDEVASGKIAGAGLPLIQQHGSPIYLKCFGSRDPVTKTPMTPDTIFPIHSMTKAVTSFAVMMLIDQGRLSLDDPLPKYIPAFAAAKVAVVSEAGDRLDVTLTLPDRAPNIEDLLRHTSGISNGSIGKKATREIYEAARIYDGQFDNEIFAERIARLPLVVQPGTLKLRPLHRCSRANYRTCFRTTALSIYEAAHP